MVGQLYPRLTVTMKITYHILNYPKAAIFVAIGIKKLWRGDNSDGGGTTIYKEHSSLMFVQARRSGNSSECIPLLDSSTSRRCGDCDNSGEVVSMMMTTELEDAGESYPALNIGYTLLRYVHHFCVLFKKLAFQ